MRGSENMEKREDIYSKAIRAGKRTYFFDVKSTKGGENFITITESKKKFHNDQGKFYFEKHKIFLYKEDYEKFANGLEDILEFVIKNKGTIKTENEFIDDSININSPVEVKFEDLGDEEKIDI
jgi:hypothetical protein